VNEERAPVSFKAAKPVDKKTRHPFSGQPISEPPLPKAPLEWEQESKRDPEPSLSPYNLVLDDLRRKRDEIDTAIRLIESLR
jgi:hypothetical protein